MDTKQDSTNLVQLSFGNQTNPMCLVLGNREQSVEISYDSQQRKCKLMSNNCKMPWIPPPCRTKINRPCVKPVNELVINMPTEGKFSGGIVPFTIESSRLDNFKASFYPALLSTRKEEPVLDRAKDDRKRKHNFYMGYGKRNGTVSIVDAVEKSKSQVRLIKDSILSIQESIKDLEERQKSMGKVDRYSKQGLDDKFLPRTSVKNASIQKSDSRVKPSIEVPCEDVQEVNKFVYPTSKSQVVEQLAYPTSKSQIIEQLAYPTSKSQLGEQLVYPISISQGAEQLAYPSSKSQVVEAQSNGFSGSSQNMINDRRSENVAEFNNQSVCPAHPLIRNKTCSECQYIEMNRQVDPKDRCKSYPFRKEGNRNFPKQSSRLGSLSSVSVESMMTRLADSMRKSKVLVDAVCQEESSASNIQKKYIKNAEALYKDQQKIIQSICSAIDVGNNFNLPESGSSDFSRWDSVNSRGTLAKQQSKENRNLNQLMDNLKTDARIIQSEIEMKENEIEDMKRNAMKLSDSAKNNYEEQQSLNKEIIRASTQAEMLKQELSKVKDVKKKISTGLKTQKSVLAELSDQSKEFSFDPRITSSKKSLSKKDDDNTNSNDLSSHLDHAESDIVHHFSYSKAPEFEETKTRTIFDENDRCYPKSVKGGEKSKEFLSSVSSVEEKAKKLKEILSNLAPLIQEKLSKNLSISPDSSIIMDHHEESYSLSVSDGTEKGSKKDKLRRASSDSQTSSGSITSASNIQSGSIEDAHSSDKINQANNENKLGKDPNNNTTDPQNKYYQNVRERSLKPELDQMGGERIVSKEPFVRSKSDATEVFEKQRKNRDGANRVTDVRSHSLTANEAAELIASVNRIRASDANKKSMNDQELSKMKMPEDQRGKSENNRSIENEKKTSSEKGNQPLIDSSFDGRNRESTSSRISDPLELLQYDVSQLNNPSQSWYAFSEPSESEANDKSKTAQDQSKAERESKLIDSKTSENTSKQKPGDTHPSRTSSGNALEDSRSDQWYPMNPTAGSNQNSVEMSSKLADNATKDLFDISSRKGSGMSDRSSKFYALDPLPKAGEQEDPNSIRDFAQATERSIKKSRSNAEIAQENIKRIYNEAMEDK